MPSARVKKLEHFTILYKWTINGAPHSFSRKVTAKSILTNMRLNDEPSDPTTTEQSLVMMRMEWPALSAAASTMAPFATKLFASELYKRFEDGGQVNLSKFEAAVSKVLESSMPRRQQARPSIKQVHRVHKARVVA